MEKRTLIAIVLSILVLLLFQYVYRPDFKPPQDNKTIILDNSNAKPSDLKDEATLESGLVRQDTYEIKPTDLINIENDYLLITFNKKTGNINEIAIKKYENKVDKSVSFKTAYGDYFKLYNIGKPSDYKVEKKTDTTTIDFIFSSNEFILNRVYTVKKSSLLINIKETFVNISNNSISFDYFASAGPGLGSGFDESKYIFNGPLIYNNRKIIKKKAEDVKKDIIVDKPFWFGYTSKYFLAAIVDTGIGSSSIKSFGESANVIGFKKYLIHSNEKIVHNFDIYTGPKEYNLLKSMGSGLEKSIDFGMFFFLAIPFLQCLIFFDRIFDNYGIAIIILTMILKFITLPLNSMSMKSMKKMQKVQPEILKIREKFKGEPQKMNAAVMELYKKNKVNPVSGCLPMLIQIPIFIALYRMLLVSIELKNSPFFGWISDLSLKDPYYVSPILMGISMFVQQRMTPSTAVDPMQQKIFMLMPVIFTFLFINFPSGLVLYWLVNNILTIAHQFYLNKKLT